MRALVTTLITLSFLAACDDPVVRVGQTILPDADGVRAAPPGPTVEITAQGALPAAPAGGGVVRVVAGTEVPWQRVRDGAEHLRRQGATPVLMVGHNRKLVALEPTDAAVPASILVLVMADHKTCIAPPGADERLCVQRSDGRHVDRAAVRSLVRDAVKAYALDRVHVDVDPSVSYADAVRAIDGARTCCKHAVHVSVEGVLLP